MPVYDMVTLMDILAYKNKSRKSWAQIAEDAGYPGPREVIKVTLFRQAHGMRPISPKQTVALIKASGGKITLAGIAKIKRGAYVNAASLS